MKYRWDICQLTYSLQTCTTEIFCGFIHETCFCSSLCRTSGCYDYDIVSNQFLHHLDMCIVRADLRIVTSNHCNCTTDNTRCYTLKKRFGCSGYIYLAVGNTVKVLSQVLPENIQQLLSASYPGYIQDPVYGS